jgi:integrase
MAGVSLMLQTMGVHCNPYRFRHTFCTWCADAGMHMLHLQQLLSRMKRRYTAISPTIVSVLAYPKGGIPLHSRRPWLLTCPP